jgi:hypothetical protein
VGIEEVSLEWGLEVCRIGGYGFSTSVVQLLEEREKG